jgi:formylglycine-generating enzyme required for sulfatase activity
MNLREKRRSLFWCLIPAAVVLAGFSLLALSQSKNATSGKNAVDMEFVKIAPGEFIMGCSDGDTQCNADEKPAHRVRITKAFEMGKYEVTQAQWRSVMNTNPSTVHGDNHPVETVAKSDAEEFLAKLNAQNDGYRYRLPTEAEWEYAARAGTKSAFAGKLSDIAWYSENSEDETHPVGTKKPNAWGLYDMEGNVREWVSDTYGANYYSNSPQDDPTGPAPGQQGGRGGRGGPGPQTALPPDAPCGGPPNPQIKDLELQIDCLRQQVAFLLQQLQGPGPRGGGFGGPNGPPPRGGGPGGGPNGRGGPGGPGAPGGPGGNLPVMRGGGWDNLESFLRVSARYNYYGPTLRVSDVGFRVVREPVAK